MWREGAIFLAVLAVAQPFALLVSQKHFKQGTKTTLQIHIKGATAFTDPMKAVLDGAQDELKRHIPTACFELATPTTNDTNDGAAGTHVQIEVQSSGGPPTDSCVPSKALEILATQLAAMDFLSPDSITTASRINWLVGSGCLAKAKANVGIFVHNIFHWVGFVGQINRADSVETVYLQQGKATTDPRDDAAFKQYTSQKLSNIRPFDFASIMMAPYNFHTPGILPEWFSDHTVMQFPPSIVGRLSYGKRRALSQSDIYSFSQHLKCGTSSSYAKDRKTCANGGTFIGYKMGPITSTTSGGNTTYSYEPKIDPMCLCKGGYQGDTCSDKDNDIECELGATEDGGNKCTCPSGKTGVFCEATIADACGPACANYNRCENKICNCANFPMYSGPACTNATCGTACENEGWCSAPNKCTCTKDYGGAHCQTRIGSTTTTIAPRDGSAVCTRSPLHFFINEQTMYMRIVLRDLPYLTAYSNLASTESIHLQRYLKQALGPMFTVSAALSFVDLTIRNICADATGVSVDFMTTFTDSLSYAHKSKLALNTAVRQSLTATFDRNTRTLTVTNAEYITSSFRLISGKLVCGVYSTERACQNGGECEARQGLPVCRCTAGFRGTYCDNKYNDDETDWWIYVAISAGAILLLAILRAVILIACRRSPNRRYNARNTQQQPAYIIQPQEMYVQRGQPPAGGPPPTYQYGAGPQRGPDAKYSYGQQRF